VNELSKRLLRLYQWVRTAQYVVGAIVCCSTIAFAQDTVFTLQMREGVEISSIVVRLRDIARPVGQQPTEWQRMADATVALLPTDGRKLRIEKQRVMEAYQRLGGNLQNVEWTGPSFTTIQFVAMEPLPLLQVSGASAPVPVASQAIHQNSQPLLNSSPETLLETIDLLPAERNRIERLVMTAFAKTHRELLTEYESQAASEQLNLALFKGLRSIQSVRLLESAQPGINHVHVCGAGDTTKMEGQFSIELIPLPEIVVATASLNRGDVISDRDLEFRRVTRTAFRPEFLTRKEDLIGKEVTRGLSAGRPLVSADVSVPLVIRRGDLVELRILGAGVVVSTNAKALASAAEGESVLVETESPRKRIAGRAARAGIVEVISRPPGVNNGADNVND
jgi:flagella basal body P-ring formation protein FlgA